MLWVGAELLASNRVTWINFDIGSVKVRGQWYRELSRMFVTKLGDRGLHTVVHPSAVISEKAEAVYLSGNDTVYFSRFDVLYDEEGRGTGVHEATHAMCDYRGRSTAILTEEGAAHLAEALYLLSADTDKPVPSSVPTAIHNVAVDVRARIVNADGAPAVLTGKEIQIVRTAVFNLRDKDGSRSYEMAHYTDHNGIGGRRASG